MPRYPILLFASCLALAACEPVSMMTTLGASAGGQAIEYTRGGNTYRTFTDTPENVKKASVNALRRMGLEILGEEKVWNAELIKAAAARRSVEVEIEPISANATAVRVLTKDGVFSHDRATSTEILQQIEKMLTAPDRKLL